MKTAQYQVFSYTLTASESHDNAGEVIYSLLQGEDVTDTLDPSDWDLAGTLFVSEEWELDVSEDGTPIFYKLEGEVETLVPVASFGGPKIPTLQNQSLGIWFEPILSMTSTHLANGKQWQALAAHYLATY